MHLLWQIYQKTLENTCSNFDTSCVKFSFVWQPFAKLKNIIEWVSGWLTRQSNHQTQVWWLNNWWSDEWTIKCYGYQLPIIIIYSCGIRYIYIYNYKQNIAYWANYLTNIEYLTKNAPLKYWITEISKYCDWILLAQQIVKLILSSCQRNPPLEEIEEFQSDSSKSGRLVQPPDWQYYGSIFLLDNLENNFLRIHRWWRGWICKSVGFQPVTTQSTSMRGSLDFRPETKNTFIPL